MATVTRRELVDQAATKVGALGAGQTLAAEDLDVIDRMASALFDQLAEDEILSISDEEEIPASWSPFLASLLANLIGPDYGIAFTQDVKVVNEAILRKLVRAKATFEPLAVDYF
jgi:hypothetical protein